VEIAAAVALAEEVLVVVVLAVLEGVVVVAVEPEDHGNFSNYAVSL
jgi:hypothetical protein